MNLKLANTVSGEWLSARVVRVGVVPRHLPTADMYVLLSGGGQPLFRVDIYGGADEAYAFQDAEVWSDQVVIGVGHRVHFVSCDGTTVVSHRLESYFGHLYTTPEYLLVASAACVTRFNRRGELNWTSEPVGLDGVVVDNAGPPVVSGEGEWDPPGGWRPFALNADTGALVG